MKSLETEEESHGISPLLEDLAIRDPKAIYVSFCGCVFGDIGLGDTLRTLHPADVANKIVALPWKLDHTHLGGIALCWARLDNRALVYMLPDKSIFPAQAIQLIYDGQESGYNEFCTTVRVLDFDSYRIEPIKGNGIMYCGQRPEDPS